MYANSRRSAFRLCTAVVSFTCILLSAPVTASAVVPTVTISSLQNVSGVSPWYGTSCNPAGPSVWNILADTEPDIAVNPTNSNIQIAAWQDKYQGNIVTAYTHDGGQTWTRSIPPHLTNCTGAPFNPDLEPGYDATVSFAPDGTAYLTSENSEHAYHKPYSQYEGFVYVSKSTDGGATWAAPAAVPNANNASDKAMVFADQQRPDQVYVAMRNTGFGTPIGSRGIGQLLLSRSTDGGQTFSTSVLSSTGSTSSEPYNSQIAQTQSGTLIYTYDANDNPTGALEAIRSTDGGATWSAPTVVAPALAITPEISVCGNSVAMRADGGHDAIIGGNTIAVARVYNGPTGTGPGQVLLSTSTDQGQTWTTSTVANSTQPIMSAQIAGNAAGQLGLVYYALDLANVNCSSNPVVIPAQTRVAASGDRGQSWSATTTLGAQWWNVAASGVAPDLWAYWVGEYFGLAPTASGFAVSAIEGPTLQRGSGPEPTIIGTASAVVAQIHVTTD